MSEAYWGSLRSGGQSGMLISRLAAIQTWAEFLDIKTARIFNDVRAS